MQLNTLIKWAKKLVVACSLGIALSLILSYTFIQSETKAQIYAPENLDMIIVLGAGLWGDQVSPQLALRLETAYALLEANPDLTAIVSGGQGPDELISEAAAMKAYLVNLGIDDARIHMEDRSTSTYENLSYSFQMISELQVNPQAIGLVTTDFHVFRAKMLSRRLGQSLSAQAAPNIQSIAAKNTLRETLALIKDFMFSH